MYIKSAKEKTPGEGITQEASGEYETRFDATAAFGLLEGALIQLQKRDHKLC